MSSCSRSLKAYRAWPTGDLGPAIMHHPSLSTHACALCCSMAPQLEHFPSGPRLCRWSSGLHRGIRPMVWAASEDAVHILIAIRRNQETFPFRK
jgi:hypothetical protein